MPNRNGRAAVLTDGAAKLNIFFYDTTSEGKPLRRAQELRLERAHIPVFTIFWTTHACAGRAEPAVWLRCGASD